MTKTMPKQQVIKVCAKCSDLFSAVLVEDGKQVGEYSGYVPEIFPGQHYGDYVQLDIDVKTGVVLNWKVPSEKQLKETFDKSE